MPQADIAQDLKDYLSQSATITTDAQLRNYVKTTSRTLAAEGYPIRVGLDEAHAYIGQEVGITKWFPITQKRVNRFAESIGDYQFLHIDQERTTRETCYSGTIAHGMLTMSLLPTFATYAPENSRHPTMHHLWHGPGSVFKPGTHRRPYSWPVYAAQCGRAQPTRNLNATCSNY